MIFLAIIKILICLASYLRKFFGGDYLFMETIAERTLKEYIKLTLHGVFNFIDIESPNGGLGRSFEKGD